MNRNIFERNLVVILFIVVLVTFSLAERDSKKLEKIYSTSALIKKNKLAVTETAVMLSNELKGK